MRMEVAYGDKEDERIKKFLDYFENLDNSGTPYSFGDMCVKATELGLPIPHRDDKGRLYW